jgi:hypothetical protein
MADFDITIRLRAAGSADFDSDLYDEAADEIERLRAVVRYQDNRLAEGTISGDEVMKKRIRALERGIMDMVHPKVTPIEQLRIAHRLVGLDL